MADAANDAQSRSFAPLFVGVTGKLDLHGRDDAVRAALDLMFNRLDARCTTTPKVLMSGLARGADTVAAEAALARPDWSVIAVLPLAEALYLEDFDETGRSRFAALKRDSRVKVLTLDPLRSSVTGRPFTAGELTRATGGPHPLRADHYEQAGLFISERSAILLAVMPADEVPDRIGGSARIVHYRLTGELDDAACAVATGSTVLEEPPRLVDRRTGPVWIADLAALGAAPEAPAKALAVRLPFRSDIVRLGHNQRTAASLALADSVEGVNRRLARIDQPVWEGIEWNAGPDVGDAASYLKRLRYAISGVQGAMVTRVRNSIGWLAVLSCAAIFAFEVYVAWPARDWTSWGSVAYPVLVVGAILVYWRAGGPRLQRFAEDYRAVAEALRVQLVWWASGLNHVDDRIERYYLRGSHGALRQLRLLISALIDAALLQFDAPASDPGAASAWVNGQIEFFQSRIGSRHREIAIIESTSWFLFATSLGVAVCLAAIQIWGAKEASDVLTQIIEHDRPSQRLLLWGLGGTAVFLGLALNAIRSRLTAKNDELDAVMAPSNRSVAISGLVAGVVLAFTLIALAAAHGGVHDGAAATARELIEIAIIMPLTVAGALRFISEKSSWASELTGYEHALEHFRQGRRELAAAPETAHRGIIQTLGSEALTENENWLRSHRERPIEPIVGG